MAKCLPGVDLVGIVPYYIINNKKQVTLTKNILSKKESDRFLKTAQNLIKLKPGELIKLNIEINKSKLKKNNKKGIF